MFPGFDNSDLADFGTISVHGVVFKDQFVHLLHKNTLLSILALGSHIWIVTLPPLSYVTLSQLPYLSELEFFLLQNEVNNT